MSTIIQDTRTALQTVLNAQSLNTYKYEAWDLPSQSPVATLTLTNGIVDDSYDQGFGFKRLEFLVRIYQQVQGPNAEQSLIYQDASIHKCLTAIGADRTLGSKVVNTEIQAMNVFFERIGNVAYTVAEFRVEVTPFPNVG